MKIFQRIVLFIICLSMIGLPTSIESVQAQTLEYDQRCFTQEECTQARSSFLRDDDEVANGFIQNEQSQQNCGPLLQQNPGKEVGFCTAGGVIETGINIAGKNRFDDVGDFIVTIFQFSFAAAIAFAIVMIIVSGILWMTSAGNSSIIGDAKKRIGGALLGVLLLSLSYTILDTVNPNLTTLKQPSVYILRADVLEPITSEQLCDPDGEGPFGSCPDNQYCLKTAGLSLEESLDGACEQAAVGAILTPILVAAGVTALPAAGSAVIGALNTGAGAVISYIPIIGGQPLTLGSVAAIGGAGIKITGYTIAGAATYELASLANQVTGFSTEARLAYQQFTQSRGICVERNGFQSLQAGDLCSTDPNAPVTCANGLTCITDDTINNIVGCWSPGAAIGFCASGGRGSRCTGPDDCNEDLRCEEFDLPGRYLDGKICTDGGDGAYCEHDSDCTGSCVGNLCTGYLATEEFDVCTSSANCSTVTGRYEGNYECFMSTNYCEMRQLQNEVGQRKGVCLGARAGTVRKGVDECTRYQYLTEDGTCLGSGNLFLRSARAVADEGGFQPPSGWVENSCRGNLNFSDTAFETMVTDLTSRGYRF